MLIDAIERARVLIVDDEHANVRVLELLLELAGYRQVLGITDSRQFAELYVEFEPDIVLLDLHMPHLDGFALLERMASMQPAGAYLPVLVLTADITVAAKQRALQAGAKD